MASEPAAWHRLFPSLPHGAYCTQTRRLTRRPRILSILSGPLSDHHHKSQNPQHADGQQATIYVGRVPVHTAHGSSLRSSHACTHGLRRRLRRLRISPMRCTGSSEPNSARTFHAPSTRSLTYTLEAPASLIPVENTIVEPSYWVFNTDNSSVRNQHSDGGITSTTMTSLLHGSS